MEGDIAPADCVSNEDVAGCMDADACVTRIIWEKIRDSINQVIDSITLEDMVNQQKMINSRKDANSSKDDWVIRCKN